MIVAPIRRPMLRVQGLTKRYGEPRPRTIFAGVDLALDAGDYVAIMGESGSGKSTLLNLVAGLDRADAGSITLDVAANVGLPLSLLGLNSDVASERVRIMLAAVGLAERAASRPSELSGGELQRVAIARALVHTPRLVLADEPTGNLDADSAAQVLRLLREQIRANRAAGILVTHSTVAAATADRVLMLTPDGLRPK